MREVARAAFAHAPAADPPPGTHARIADAEERFANHFMAVLEDANTLFLRDNAGVTEGLALYDREARNTAAAVAWARHNWEHTPAASHVAASLPIAGRDVLHLRLPPRERIAWLDVARHAAERLGRRDLFGRLLGNLGVALADLGETPRAIKHHEQHLAIAREIGDRQGEGNALGNLGIAWAALRETRRAIGLYEEHLAIAREIRDRRGEGNALGNLGNAWAALGETRRAIELYEQRLAIAHEIGDRRGAGNALYCLALDHDALGDRPRAIGLAEQALAIYDTIESPWADKARAKLAEWRGDGPAGGS